MNVFCEVAAPFVANSAVEGSPVARPFRAHADKCLKCQARHAAMSRTARELAAMSQEKFNAPLDLEWRVMSALEGDLAVARILAYPGGGDGRGPIDGCRSPHLAAPPSHPILIDRAFVPCSDRAIEGVFLYQVERKADLMKALITTASKHGSTAEIGGAIGEVLLEHGIETDVLDPEAVIALQAYDVAILGSAVYAGHWMKSMRELAERFAGSWPPARCGCSRAARSATLRSRMKTPSTWLR